MRCTKEVHLNPNLLLKLAMLLSITAISVHAQPMVMIGLDKENVNASEGNTAVVCVTAMFFNNTPSTVTVNVSLVNITNSSGQLINADLNDFNVSTINPLTFTSQNAIQCLRILTNEDSILEGTETFHLELESIDPFVIIIQPLVTINILETCYDGEVRLRGGFDENQGRVEICFGGVWGTVCDNGWDESDANVVCTQLGSSSGDGVEPFPNAIFGPASYALPVHMDMVDCSGAENQLSKCNHTRITSCRHSEDASVDCLGRSVVGRPCSNEGSARLVGGMDQFQGRVEICSSGIYSAVCHNRWDIQDAQVICRQLSLSNASAVVVATTNSVFQIGAGTILYSDISCVGNESNILDCSLSVRRNECNHFQEAGVDCLGRQTFGATVDFERQRGDVAIREGQSLQLCAIVVSGSLPHEELFSIYPPDFPTRKKRGNEQSATFQTDYVIEYPIQQRQRIYLGPYLNRSCINITAIDDSEQEPLEMVTVRLGQGDKSNALLTINNADAFYILDDDSVCTNGDRLCVDTEQLVTECINREHVCDGQHDCSDGSDEDCPDYCEMSEMEGFNCISEKLCVPQERVCDGYPDCVIGTTVFDEMNCFPELVGCTHGDIRTPLLGGVADTEGLIEVCFDGTYYTVSLDDGRFSVREATVICKQLGLGKAGMPLNVLRSFGFEVLASSNELKIHCDNEPADNATNLTACSLSLSTTISTQQAGIRCFQTELCQDGDIRIINDADEEQTEGCFSYTEERRSVPSNFENAIEGRIEICFQNVWGAIYDTCFSNMDAAVACHQLGYSRYGAIPTPYLYYGMAKNVPFVLNGIECTGNEGSLLQCEREQAFGEVNKYRDEPYDGINMAGVRCEQYSETNCSYLDVRLTFRHSVSSGLVEICNENNTWSIMCSNVIREDEVMDVICRQLGFNPGDDSNERLLRDEKPRFSELTRECIGNETTLRDCRERQELLQPRNRGSPDLESIPDLCEVQAGVLCGANPRVYFHPPNGNRIYTVEQHRNLSLSCFWDQHIYPPVTGFFNSSRQTRLPRLGRGIDDNTAIRFSADPSRQTRTRREFDESIDDLMITFLQTDDASPLHEEQYYCTASSRAGTTNNCVSVTVLVPEGPNESACVRISHLSVERIANTNFSSFNVAMEQAQSFFQTQLLLSIDADFPGIQVVDNCNFVNRRPMETERGLDRLECRVTQYRGEEEVTLPLVQVLEKAVRIFERKATVAPLVPQVTISGTGFCSREIVSATGTTFEWPETIGGTNASYLCPNNATVTRRCEVGGQWQDFDCTGCAPNYCRLLGMEGFNCISEERCVPLDYVCDRIPDCVQGSIVFDEMNCPPPPPESDGCTHGQVRRPLLGGISENEGVVEVCVNGIYLPVSLDDGNFSVREASIVCTQLMPNKVGIPLNAVTAFGFHVGASSRAAAKLKCGGTAEADDETPELSQCEISISIVSSDSIAGVRCFEPENCREGDIRLRDTRIILRGGRDLSSQARFRRGNVNPDLGSGDEIEGIREGRVEICHHNVWSAIYDDDWSNKDAAVICHQLGFSRYGAIPSFYSYYGNTENIPFVLSNPTCQGNENSLFQCVDINQIAQSAFGRTGKYRSDNDAERNTVGVRCEAYVHQSCTHLGVRLTFRSASSTGLVEICNRDTWSIACADAFGPSEARVICRQLGFDSNFVNYTQHTVISDVEIVGEITTPTCSTFVGCLGNEENLSRCHVRFVDRRRKRGAQVSLQPTCASQDILDPVCQTRGLSNSQQPTCAFQAAVQCGARPEVILFPPSPTDLHIVKQQRGINLTCSWNQNIYPPVTRFTNSTLLLVTIDEQIHIQTKRGVANGELKGTNTTLINIFKTSNALPTDQNGYICRAESPLGTIQRSTFLRVQVPEGLNESVYLRLSHISFERFANASTSLVTEEDTFQNLIQQTIISSINPEIQGLYIVDNCTNVSRRRIDSLRGLDRFQCRVTQYSGGEIIIEEIRPVFEVVEEAAAILNRYFSPVVIGANVSDTNFCDREVIITNATIFDWPETVGGANASFECPNNGVVMTRFCEIGGQWAEFDPIASGSQCTSFCRREVIETSGIIWPETLSGTNVSLTCPNNPRVSVTRVCNSKGVWLSFNEEACGVVGQLLSGLNNSFTNLTDTIYEGAVSTLAQIIGQSENNTVEQNTAVLDAVADYSTDLASFVASSNVMINDTVVNDIVQVVSSLLQWEPENIAVASSSSVLQSFEEVVALYAQQLLLNETRTFTAPSLVVVAESRLVGEGGRTFITSGNRQELVLSDPMIPLQLSSQQDAAVNLPRSVFQQINDSENVGIFFGRYEAATLFPVEGRSAVSDARRQAQVCSRVLAATVGQNVSIQNLEEPVTVLLRLQNKEGMFTAPDSERCVSWDFDLQDWTPQGCNTSVGQDGIITCHCNHLTNFAVIVEVCSRQKDCLARRRCEEETIESTSGTTYIWPGTFEGNAATFTCPLSPAVSVNRTCGVGGVWEPFNEEACGVVNEQLNQLNSSFNNLTVETYEAAVATLSQVIEQSENSIVEQNSQVLNTVANYITDLATFVNDSMVEINQTVVSNVVQVVSSLLQWEPENIQVASSSSLVQSFEVVIYLYAQQLPLNVTQTFTLPMLTLVAEFADITSLEDNGRSFSIGDDEVILGPEGDVMPGQLPPQLDAAISLPASLFETISDRDNVSVFFALYDTPILFPVNGGSSRSSDGSVQTEVGSSVLAATVGPDINFLNLAEPVIIVLRLQTSASEGRFPLPGSEICVSWDFFLQNWTPEGCNTTVGEDGIVTCNCNHLTNFAVLVDICLRQDNCQPTNPIFADTLTFVSYIGMTISIISLVITIVTMLTFRKLREKDASKYHIQLSLAILLMLIVSLALIALSAENVASLYGGCVMVSVFVHYFTLVAVMWMGAEALLMFQKLVIIFTRITTKFIIMVSILCWTVPIAFVFIPLIADLATGTDPASDIVVHRANATAEDISFCFLSHPGAFWGTFLAPILAVMVFNVVIFVWVIVILIRHTRGTAARKKEAVNNKTIVRLMISISGVMFLFGLTWLFAILTFSAPGFRETFQALFTVFNSFQGFFIFLFFCVFSQEAREYWKEVLSCGRYTSQFLHPSQTRNVSTSGAFAKKIKKATVSTGLSSSSAEKSGYASETISKVSNHYESNTIIKQVAAGQVEKIPLDYESPKQCIAMVEPTIQTFKSGDADNSNESTSKDNESEANAVTASNDISTSTGSVSEVAVVVVETAFSGEANANNQQQKDEVETEEKQK